MKKYILLSLSFCILVLSSENDNRLLLQKFIAGIGCGVCAVPLTFPVLIPGAMIALSYQLDACSHNESTVVDRIHNNFQSLTTSEKYAIAGFVTSYIPIMVKVIRLLK